MRLAQQETPHQQVQVKEIPVEMVVVSLLRLVEVAVHLLPAATEIYRLLPEMVVLGPHLRLATHRLLMLAVEVVEAEHRDHQVVAQAVEERGQILQAGFLEQQTPEEGVVVDIYLHLVPVLAVQVS